MKTLPIRKAVFPVAGFGSRFLPVTKAHPKEMLPIVDKPLIQYAVEEAISAGITEFIFVTSGLKRSIEDHFDSNFELESRLKKQEKWDLLAIVKDILPENCNCVYVRQKEPLGLGHAVLCAKAVVDNEPFAVLLADDLIDGRNENCMRSLVSAYEETASSIIAVEKIAPQQTEHYGVVDIQASVSSLAKLVGIVEKPKLESAPSLLGVMGRYILTPRIFSLLEATAPGTNGEIQLTDAIAKLLCEENVYAWQFAGKRYDCGNRLGYLEAVVTYALKHPELGPACHKKFTEILNNIPPVVSLNPFEKEVV